jgi:sugar-phosphatase
MIQAVIFDLDGLLIDDEPFWREAKSVVFKKIGVPVKATLLNQTTGLRTDEVVELWYKHYPWETPSKKEVAILIIGTVTDLIKDRGKPKVGVNEVIALCESLSLPIAIASSSPMPLVLTILRVLGINQKIKVVHSAYDEILGKPNPAVYISTAKDLGVSPDNCLVFEDSVNGVLAAKAAGMKCIAIPTKEMRINKQIKIADLVLNSLEDFSVEIVKGW